ncbi:MAG: TIGR02391 family protein [Methylophilus sp.]|jgi:uncharacterized protein (TIGR02391 family)|uniref:TIGR02391 family protein n=1 Tax=Methylophilus sp. TaxID=29541 RepID=UPI0040371293
MLEWTANVYHILREINFKAMDCIEHLNDENDEAARLVQGYLRQDWQQLNQLFTQKQLDNSNVGNMSRHIRFGQFVDYKDIIKFDIPACELQAEEYERNATNEPRVIGFEDLLHPIITASSLTQYKDGHIREAVLNSITAIFDLIRSRTGIKEDGSKLVIQALSLENPYLILSELESESGKNDQKGFIQIIQGAYQGIRNPKAHSLNHDLDEIKAAQYLVFASLLIRRIDEAAKAS